MDYRKLARGLGWFSVALGALEVVAPGKLSKFLGVDDERRRKQILRGAYGAREIAAGIGLLSKSKQSPFLMGRVLGDGLDLVSLLGLLGKSNRRKTVFFAIMNVVAVTVLDMIAGTRTAAGEKAEAATRRVAFAQA